ncbi:hypothetical protein F8388_004931 [Cannabis sativa]|uniref:Uncharacterized protein n=1 Tax=Cannabis sativa TaxID=3483 RepID=A0A7J6HP00_CANSA|nr:hypothetical protein F8388_004931 [Cannabis sativa]
MAFNNRFTLVLFIAFAFMSIDNGLAARNLLQSTGPNLPKPNIPSIPSLPQPNLPTLPNGLTMPPLPSLPIGPTIPKLSFPPMPNPKVTKGRGRGLGYSNSKCYLTLWTFVPNYELLYSLAVECGEGLQWGTKITAVE